MIDAADEGLHLQECDPQKNWMENMCFFGFDEAADAGFLIHVKHRPNEDIVEFRFGAKIGGQSCSYGVVHPINGTLAYPEFQLACWEPDRPAFPQPSTRRRRGSRPWSWSRSSPAARPARVR